MTERSRSSLPAPILLCFAFALALLAVPTASPLSHVPSNFVSKKEEQDGQHWVGRFDSVTRRFALQPSFTSTTHRQHCCTGGYTTGWESTANHPGKVLAAMIKQPSSSSLDADLDMQVTSPSSSKKKTKVPCTPAVSIEGVKKSKRGACDSCRTRKVKCLRLDVKGVESGSEACIPCRGIRVECTYDYVPKRPGPQSTKHTRQSQAAGTTQDTSDRRRSSLKEEDAEEARTKGLSFPSNTGRGSFASSSSYASTSSTSLEEAMSISLPTKLTALAPPRKYSLDAGTQHNEQPPISPRSRHLLPPPQVPVRSALHPTSLDDIAPRQTFMNIISLYYQHLYPLCPLVHQPTFSQDVLYRRDEGDVDFLIFVLSLTSYTLVQAPRSLIPPSWSSFRELQRLCHQTSRRMQNRTYEVPKLIHLSTLYLDHIYLGSTGLNNAANAVLGEAIRLGFTIGIHDERSPDDAANASRPPHSTSNIARELRRRMFFILYGSDRTIALLQEQPICLRDEDSFGVQLPLSIDDDLITDNAIYPQPPERGPSVLCGFETVSKLFLLLSALLDSHRRDVRMPPNSLDEIRERKTFISGMLHQVKGVLAAMPRILQAPPQHTNDPLSLSCFATMRVNILITETMIRFAVAEYTEFLRQFQERYEGPSAQDSIYLDSDWEMAANEMVNTLNSMPFDSIAANGQSMISKLLYLTSTLLNRSPAGSPGFQYMCHFLDTLTRLTSSRNEPLSDVESSSYLDMINNNNNKAT